MKNNEVELKTAWRFPALVNDRFPKVDGVTSLQAFLLAFNKRTDEPISAQVLSTWIRFNPDADANPVIWHQDTESYRPRRVSALNWPILCNLLDVAPTALLNMELVTWYAKLPPLPPAEEAYALV